MVLSVIGLGSAAVSYAEPGTLQFSKTNFTINEGGSTAGLVATFYVTRTGGSDDAVSVTYTTSDGTATAGSDYTTTPTTLNWNDGDSEPKSGQVPIIDDNDNNEGNETFTITLSNPTGGASLGTPNPATMTIVDDCGPGAHWIDTCPAGTDNMTNTTADMRIEIPCGNSPGTAVTTSGPTVVNRDAGQSAVSPHSINTEIVSMVLKGDGITVRAGTDEGVTLQSLGKITEQGSDPTKADSYFDIYFEIDGTPFGTLHNKNGEPMRVETVIDKVPPYNSLYENGTQGPIDLYNADETQIIGCLIHAKHQVDPPIEPPPDLVTLVDNSFIATAGLNITWETASEVDNAGFFIWRGQLKAGKTECSLNIEDYVEVKKIGPFIQAQGTGAPYSYFDNQVASGNSYCYALEDIDLADKSTFHFDDLTFATMP